MNTKEFIQTLAERLEISQKEAAGLLGNTTDLIRKNVTEESNVTIRSLGSFRVTKRGSHTAFIPALGKKAIVPPHCKVQFHPAETLKNKLKNTPRP